MSQYYYNMEKNRKNMTLEEAGNRIPFTVPENYFEEFALKMEGQTGQAVTVPFRKMVKPWVYLAAMFVGVIMMGKVFYTVHSNNVAKNAENYELYMVSQVDESLVYENYLNEAAQTNESDTKGDKSKGINQ